MMRPQAGHSRLSSPNLGPLRHLHRRRRRRRRVAVWRADGPRRARSPSSSRSPLSRSPGHPGPQSSTQPSKPSQPSELCKTTLQPARIKLAAAYKLTSYANPAHLSNLKIRHACSLATCKAPVVHCVHRHNPVDHSCPDRSNRTATLTGADGKEYTAYIVKCTGFEGSWETTKRFTDFSNLRAALVEAACGERLARASFSRTVQSSRHLSTCCVLAFVGSNLLMVLTPVVHLSLMFRCCRQTGCVFLQMRSRVTNSPGG